MASFSIPPTRISRLRSGDPAPDFHAVLDDGSPIDKAALKGKRYILFFYNHDGSETCTKEACNIRDHYDRLRKKGYRVFGVSEDSIRKHASFRKKQSLPYPLISDPDNTVARAFDVYGPKQFMGRTFDTVHRTTFVIDAEGRIEVAIHPVNSGDHANQILEAISRKAN